MQNVGGLDRLLRSILSIPLLFILFYVETYWRYLGLVGFLLLFNALTRICLINRILGINTCGIKTTKEEKEI